MTPRSTPLWIAFSGLLVFLIYYSQTGAYAWDEGFHLLTAQLIFRGKTPYFDFFFPQTPLNAYWNAFWMKLFGDTWRTAHVVAAVMTAITALLAGDFTRRRTNNTLAALVTMALVGLNAMVVQFGPVGQAYGLCLVLIVFSFRLIVSAVEKASLLYPFGAGLLSAAAASASLLTAPVAPSLWVWMLIFHQPSTGKDSRIRKAIAFVVGCILGTAPVWWMILQDPKRILFDMFIYNMKYRGVNWDGDVPSHDASVILAGIDSAQALVLGLCGFAAIVLLWEHKEWTRQKRAPFYLCLAIATLLGIHISSAAPTFERYFLFMVPWLAILVGAGLTAMPERHRAASAALILTLTALGLGRSLYEERDSFTWGLWEDVARKVAEVTPPGAAIQADEHIYLITRRPPPEGMEHENSHKALPLTPEEDKRLHILPKPEMEKQVRAGVYKTIATCDDEKPVAKSIVAPLYQNKWELEQCTVYWNFHQPDGARR